MSSLAIEVTAIAQVLGCQLLHDRVIPAPIGVDGVVIITRVPAHCYSMDPQDPEFRDHGVGVTIEPGTPAELRVRNALKCLADYLEEQYPGETQRRAQLIKKISH